MFLVEGDLVVTNRKINDEIKCITLATNTDQTALNNHRKLESIEEI